MHAPVDSLRVEPRRVILSCMAALFVAASCLLAWKSVRIEHAEARYKECAAALTQGNHDLARAAIEDAVRLDGRNALYVAARGLVNAEPLEQVPFSWPIEDMSRRLSQEQRRSLQTAAADYELVVRLNSTDALAWHNLAWLRYCLGDHEGALAALRRSALLEPAEWTTQISLGLQLESGQRMTEAVSAYQQALMLNPQLVESQFFAELQQRHPRLAETIVSQALSTLQRDYTATQSPILAAKAGKLALFRGDAELAVADLQFATRQMPLLYRAWRNLGSAYALRGREAEARRCYDIARMINPLDVETRERRDNYRSSAELMESGHPRVDRPRPSKAQEFGQLSDRNVRLWRQYLHEAEIHNNVVPGTLLSYGAVVNP